MVAENTEPIEFDLSPYIKDGLEVERMPMGFGRSYSVPAIHGILEPQTSSLDTKP